MRYSMLLFIAIIGIACAGNHSASITLVAAAADDIQTQSPNTTIQSFTAVEGADLMARLEAAQTRARARQTPYWSAYTFDVRPGVAVHVNAFNFPAWGMMEKMACAILAGMPVIEKPGTPTALVAWSIARTIVEKAILPEGAYQFICGSTGDLLVTARALCHRSVASTSVYARPSDASVRAAIGAL